MFSVTRLHPVSVLLETAIDDTFFRAVHFRSNYYCSIHILVDSNGCLGKSGANATALSDINDDKEVIGCTYNSEVSNDDRTQRKIR